jgi:3-phosphoglycerate kinase
MLIPLLKDADVKGKRLLVRVDFNVPLRDGKITDDTRLRESLPTIQYLIENNAKIILMSHLGRPKGKVSEELRMDVVAERLSQLLHRDIEKVNDCVGEDVKTVANALHEGDILMLENLRFHQGEEANDEVFAEQLAELADIYVNDAFGASHRAHASVVAITKFLPSYAGLLLQKEIEVLTKVLESPEKPFIAVLGGAKVSDKINLIKNLLPKVDSLLIGGAMMFTFLKAQGKEVGKSLVEEEKIDVAKQLLQNKKIIIPVDVVVANNAESKETGFVTADKISPEKMGLDIGPKSVQLFKEKISRAKTIFWNGPLGMFEVDIFAQGTSEIASAIAASNAITVVGGGDTVAAADKLGLKNKFTHVSTGGGAMLKFLEGKELPAIAALTKKA